MPRVPHNPAPLYLATASLPLVTSSAALQNAKLGLLPWSGSLSARASELLEAIGTDDAIHAALAQASAEKLALLAQGLQRFRDYPYERTEPDYDIVWSEGSSRLCEQPGSKRQQTTLLFLPSLINRAYIFDLSPETSVLRRMREQGFRCLLMDWGDVTGAETEFGIGEYVARLGRALEALGEPVILAGYCMGGMMAMAAAQLFPEKVKALALLATPWDFHSTDVPPLPGRELYAGAFTEYLRTTSSVPGELVYQLLYSSNPWPVHDKFTRFAEMDPESEQAAAFVARESWVQDGVALTANAARSCFIEWPVHNTPMQRQWRVNGETILPENIAIPAFLAIARRDTVVPPHCAGALSLQLPNALTLYPPSGHVGMIVGAQSTETLWLPLAKWAKGL